jgi:hypothetical protein
VKRQLHCGEEVKNIPKDCLELEIDHEGEIKIYDVDSSGFRIQEVMPKLCEACEACPEEEPVEEEVPVIEDEEDDEPEFPEDDPPMEIEDDSDFEELPEGN